MAKGKSLREMLLSSIKDVDTRASVVSDHVGHEVRLTVRMGRDHVYSGQAVAVASVYGRDGYVLVLSSEEHGVRRVRAFPSSTWRSIERERDEGESAARLSKDS